MKAAWKGVVVAVLVAAVAVVFALKPGNESSEGSAVVGVPRLVELGSDSCIPCKMMMPVLDELRKEYTGRLSVEFYDVRRDPSIGTTYGIKLIPTQVFYDASGRELFRHEGFFAKEDILAKWKEFGVDLSRATE
jgi:thioredoxin 1